MSRARLQAAAPAGSWRLDAECRPGNGYDPETWFPQPQPNGSATNLQRRISALRWAEQVERAKGACRRCPVASACLDYALTNSENEGIWGGLTDDERAALKANQP